jgi:hypothetical protein
VPQTPEKATPELAEGIRSWLAERVSRHKRLEGGVHFVDAVPKNPVSVFFSSSSFPILEPAFVWRGLVSGGQCKC